MQQVRNGHLLTFVFCRVCSTMQRFLNHDSLMSCLSFRRPGLRWAFHFLTYKMTLVADWTLSQVRPVCVSAIISSFQLFLHRKKTDRPLQVRLLYKVQWSNSIQFNLAIFPQYEALWNTGYTWYGWVLVMRFLSIKRFEDPVGGLHWLVLS